MRLFTALWPPPHVLEALVADLATDPTWAPSALRTVSPTRWHVTLCFHGEAEPTVELERLAGLSELAAPRLRLAGGGAFPGVLYAAVHPAGDADHRALTALVTAAGGEPGRFVGHLTLGRSTLGRGRDRRRRPVVPAALAAHRGPWWAPAEVTLVASEPGAGGGRYTVLGRAPLRPGSSEQAGW